MDVVKNVTKDCRLYVVRVQTALQMQYSVVFQMANNGTDDIVLLV